mgnify:CR=1
MPIFSFIDKNKKFAYNPEDGISLGHQLNNNGATPKAWYSSNPS